MMAQLMPQLYQNLISTCTADEGFYFKDTQLDSIKYRIFNYRLCSYTAFNTLPSALNCRGIMFNIIDSNDVRLVSLPPEKFFNYDEGNGSRQHELGQLGVQMDKIDGSLISTFLHIDNNNQSVVRLKSKASVTSTQAVEAMGLLQGQFKIEIESLVHLQYTINMEFTSPSNQIVLYYPKPELTVLNIRSHLTGETLFGPNLIAFLQEKGFQSIIERIVTFKLMPNVLTQKEVITNIRAETQGEGYVIEIVRPDGTSYLVKVKNDSYLRLHHCKNSVNSAKSLFENVINEQSDDLRSLFKDNVGALERITQMEEQVRPKFNHLVQSVEKFYDDNKHLSRKDYAILITNTPSMKPCMALLMNLFAGKTNNYKEFAMRHAQDIFGIDGNTKLGLETNDEEQD